jgi:hypothetical protein
MRRGEGASQPPANRRLQYRGSHPLEVLSDALQRRHSGVKSGELLLNGSDDPFLLSLRGQQHWSILKATLRDMHHSRAVRLPFEVTQDGLQEVAMKALTYMRLNLEYMLINHCLRAIPDEDSERCSPRHEDVTSARYVTILRLALKVVERPTCSRQVLNTDYWSPRVMPLSLLETTTV